MSDSDKVIPKEELDKIESMVAAKQAEELSKLSESKAKEIEEKVRREMTDKAEKENQNKRIQELEEQNKKTQVEMEAKIKAEREAFDKRLQELENVKKGIVNTENPFSNNAPNLRNGIDVDKLDMKRVEEDSRKAFVEHFRLPSDFGTKK